MRQFLIKLLLILSPIILLILVEVLLPVTTFTYRPWEALQFNEKIPYVGPFYPTSSLAMDSEGDLNHHTPDAKAKMERWTIDQMGFRNDTFIEDPDIVLIGDSFLAGTGLSQEETLGPRLHDELNNRKGSSPVRVYSIAPSNMELFAGWIKNRIIHKPKVLIFSKVERTKFRPLQNMADSPFDRESLLSGLGKKVIVDKVVRVYSFRWVAARLLRKHGAGVPGKADRGMYFRTLREPAVRTNEQISADVNVLVGYKRYCDSLGIAFLFVPMPDKETVYFDKIPLSHQSGYLDQLDSMLTQNGVPTINTLKLYNHERQQNNSLLYQADDSHWEAGAVGLVARELVKHPVIKRIVLRDPIDLAK